MAHMDGLFTEHAGVQILLNTDFWKIHLFVCLTFIVDMYKQKRHWL